MCPADECFLCCFNVCLLLCVKVSVVFPKLFPSSGHCSERRERLGHPAENGFHKVAGSFMSTIRVNLGS